MDHERGTGAIRDFVPCAPDRERVGVVRKLAMSLSEVTTRLSTRSLNCGFTTIRSRHHGTTPWEREQVPETISAGTSLGSLRNRERHDCSTLARALLLAERPPSIATA